MLSSDVSFYVTYNKPAMSPDNYALLLDITLVVFFIYRDDDALSCLVGRAWLGWVA